MNLRRTARQIADAQKNLLDGVGGAKLSVNLLSPIYWSNARLNPRLKAVVPELAHGRVVDIGCGAMPYSVLYDVPGLEFAVGLDLPRIPPDFALRSDHAAYVCSDATRLPLATESMDLVLLTSVAEHVARMDDLMSEVIRCLRPGGALCMSAPFAYGVHGAPYDFWRQTPLGLREYLSQTGFTDIAIETCGGAPAAIAVGTTRWLSKKARGTDAAAVKKALLRAFAWPLVFPLLLCVNLWGHVAEALLPDDSLSPMMLAIARKPPGS